MHTPEPSGIHCLFRSLICASLHAAGHCSSPSFFWCCRETYDVKSMAVAMLSSHEDALPLFNSSDVNVPTTMDLPGIKEHSSSYTRQTHFNHSYPWHPRWNRSPCPYLLLSLQVSCLSASWYGDGFSSLLSANSSSDLRLRGVRGFFDLGVLAAKPSAVEWKPVIRLNLLLLYSMPCFFINCLKLVRALSFLLISRSSATLAQSTVASLR